MWFGKKQRSFRAMVVKLGCPTEIPDLLVENPNFTCLIANSPNLQGSGPVISIFNMPPGWLVRMQSSNDYTYKIINQLWITDQIQHIHFTDKHKDMMCTDMKILQWVQNFLKNIYIHHRSQRYAFKIYTVSLALYTHIHTKGHRGVKS